MSHRSIRSSASTAVVAALALTLTTAEPGAAQTEGDGGPLDLLEDWIERLTDPETVDELETDAEAALAEFLAVIGPLIEQAGAYIDGLPAYHAPEILPNGDILIRRRRDDGPDDGVTDI